MTIATTDVDIAEIMSVLGSSSSDAIALCTSANINLFSKCRPGYLRISSGSLVFQFPQGVTVEDPRGEDSEIGLSTQVYKIGDFRGYNHSAQMPGFGTSELGSVSIANSQATGYYDINISVYIGEVDWQGISTLYRASNNFIADTIFIKYNGDTVGSASIVGVAENGYVSIPTSLPVPSAGDTTEYSLEVYLGVSPSTILASLGNLGGAIGTGIYSIYRKAAAAAAAYEVDSTTDDLPKTVSGNYIETYEITATVSLIGTTQIQYVVSKIVERYSGGETEITMLRGVSTYMKGFSEDPDAEYLIATGITFKSSQTYTYSIPSSAPRSVFDDGDLIKIVLKNIWTL